MGFVSGRPATGDVVASFPAADPPAVHEQVEAARRAGAELASSGPGERVAWLLRMAELLEAELPVWARQLAEEVAKPFPAAKGEVARAAALLRVLADGVRRRVPLPVAGGATGTPRRLAGLPVGVVLALLPAVDPLWEAIRFLGVAVAAGDSTLLKPATSAPQLGLAVARLALEAGLPEGAVQVALFDPPAIGSVVAEPAVGGAVGAGEPRAGEALRKAAAAAGVPVAFETVGCDPILLAPSGDPSRAVALAVEGCLQQAGQGALAPHRLFVPRELASAVVEQLAAEVGALPVGDPLDVATAVGPLRSRSAVEEVAGAVAEVVAGGGRVLCGGRPGAEAGFFYLPTVVVLDDPGGWTPRGPLRGPVVVVLPYGSRDEAWSLANRGPRCLAVSLVSEEDDDLERTLDAVPASYVGLNQAVGPAAGLVAAETASDGSVGTEAWWPWPSPGPVQRATLVLRPSRPWRAS
ncbi:aldehyde dehydrogenase family protein [Aciditerrimonas ferrireducens]|jgi:acyl-CoA reductase-like NAD-dependent aldehyde dehydrogenase|nr:aldehyde dehydrogenase family protein [Aciditerrimonas ferrireducens]MCK4178083.1 aldehyde dehydrogenase family protein [Aciditerrimonas ferrireducens]